MFFQLCSSLFKKNWSFQSEEYLPLKHAVALNQFCLITFWQIPAIFMHASIHTWILENHVPLYMNFVFLLLFPLDEEYLPLWTQDLFFFFFPWMKNIYPYEHRTSWKFWHDYTVLQIIACYAMVVLYSYFLFYETQQMILNLCLSGILLLILFWFVSDLLRL